MKITCPVGHFFCEACLINKLFDEQSPDPQYCHGCYEFLLQEAATLTSKGFTGRPWWWPMAQQGVDTLKIPATPLPTIMSTEIEDIKLPQPPSGSKRGPKATELPDDLIRQWAGQGMSSKAIAGKLAEEHRIFVSYKTIKRRLQGVLNDF